MAVPRNQTALKALLGAHGLSPRKLHGQHFLADANLIEFIVRAAEVGPGDCVLEVGTGTGILTDALAEAGARVFSCDVDARLQEVTRGLRDWPERVAFLAEDVLSGKHALNPAVIRPWLESGGRPKVVSNLPYAVATPFLANLLWSGTPFSQAVVLVQKEAAERFTAPVRTHAYGPMAIAVRLFAAAEIVRSIGPQVFWPRPKVQSALLRLAPRHPERARELSDAGLPALLAEAFGQRRKTLGKRLGAARLEAAGIDPDRRAEEVEPEEWLRLLTVPPS